MSFIEIEYRETKKEWNMADLQTHDFYEIYYLIKGERNIFIEDKIFTIKENSVVIIPPFYMHKTEGGPYKRLNLYISSDLLDENEKKFLTSCANFFSFELEKGKRGAVTSLFKPFLKQSSREEPLLKKYSLPFAKSFLYMLQTSLLKPISHSQKTTASNTKENSILDVVAYINNHFRENITLDLLKSKFFISKNTLCKNFQQVMKCSVIEYCSAVRLNEARLLLPSLSVILEVSSPFITPMKLRTR